MLPDIDVIGYHLGVRYGDLWGHRGMTHSLLFAAVVAAVLAVGFSTETAERWRLGLMLFIITASHGVLDALTNGGLGVAFFSPFNPERYFFPWRPIQVSPISAVGFLSLRGLHVLLSEIVWLWGPTLVLAVMLRAIRYYSDGPRSQMQVDLQKIDH
jgi:inner membrane protein